MLKGACHCGAATWTFEGMPESATACNCTLCRRYGVLWIYDYEGERIAVAGPTTSYVRNDLGEPAGLEIRFCATCGCVVCWRSLTPGDDGRRRIAVNLRLTEPGPVAHLPIDHIDGLDTFTKLPRDARCVTDLWS
ncbi:MAG: GFA family protein [Deltaproteobacteria bacterium]|nr:GFA family protein [Deltaproteobacteria bacterium]